MVSDREDTLVDWELAFFVARALGGKKVLSIVWPRCLLAVLATSDFDNREETRGRVLSKTVPSVLDGFRLIDGT